MDLRFLDPNGQPTREAFNKRFEFLNNFVTDTPLRIDRISNEYVWEKQGDVPTADLTGTVEQVVFGGTGSWFYYSAEYSISNGSFTLVNPQKYTLSKPDNPEDILKGKYFCPTFTTTTSATLYRFDADTFGYWTGNEYRWAKCSIFGNPRIEQNTVSYVNSPYPDAYPPAVSDGFSYNLLGQLGEKVRIETGSYTGTGKKGTSNKNSLTFPFVPRLVLVFIPNLSSGTLMPWGGASGLHRSFIWAGQSHTKVCADTEATLVFSLSGNTLSWYTSDGSADGQLNNSNTVYKYLAIG